MTTTRPLISVVIRTRNRSRLLQTAIASVHAQEAQGERFDVEIVVVDDASSDETPEVCDRLDVRYVRHDFQRGAPAASNTGLQEASGSYIAFLDDDDLWFPQMLRQRVPILEGRPEVGVVYGQSIVVYGDRVSVWPKWDCPTGHVFSTLLLRGNFFTIHSALLRRTALQEAGPFDENLTAHDDYDMWLRIALNHQFAFVPGPFSVYRRSLDSVYSHAIADGKGESDFFVIRDRALSLLKQREADQLRPEVQARSRLYLAGEAQEVRDHERVGAHLVRALQETPWIVGESWGRSQLENLIKGIALESPSPQSLLQDILACARSIEIEGGYRRRLTMRRWLSDVSLAVAGILSKRSPSMKDAARAYATSAILGDPLYLLRLQKLKKVLRLLVAR